MDKRAAIRTARRNRLLVALRSWDNLRSDLRNKLNSASWGNANFPLKDSRWPLQLSRAKPSDIPFNPNV